MNSEIEQRIASLQAIADDVKMEFGDLSDQQLNWKRDPEAWSINQCFNHLNKVSALVCPMLSEAAETGRREGKLSDKPTKLGFSDWLFARITSPKPIFKVSVPKLYIPDEGELPNQVERFLQLQTLIVETAKGADGVDLNRINCPSPVSKLVKIKLGAWFLSIIGHEQYHIQQAREILKLSDFPSA
ncbi:MAG: DinB family protein [Armatimonadetes bacterium]|nr:DinB family protein [Armatimonadota bacterium]